MGAGGWPERESLVQLLVLLSSPHTFLEPSIPTNNSAALGLVGCYRHSTAVKDDRGKMHSCLSLAMTSDAQVHLLCTCRSGGSYGVTESMIVHAEEACYFNPRSMCGFVYPQSQKWLSAQLVRHPTVKSEGLTHRFHVMPSRFFFPVYIPLASFLASHFKGF